MQEMRGVVGASTQPTNRGTSRWLSRFSPARQRPAYSTNGQLIVDTNIDTSLSELAPHSNALVSSSDVHLRLSQSQQMTGAGYSTHEPQSSCNRAFSIVLCTSDDAKNTINLMAARTAHLRQPMAHLPLTAAHFHRHTASSSNWYPSGGSSSLGARDRSQRT